MCKVFSGHIIVDTNKYKRRFGEVVFLSGIHHEEDRDILFKQFPGIQLAAWETVAPFSFDEGVEVFYQPEKYSVQELKQLILDWAAKQTPEGLLRKLISVTKDGRPQDYSLDLNKRTLQVYNPDLVIDCPILEPFTLEVGDNTIIRANGRIKVDAGRNLTITAGSHVRVKATKNCNAKLGQYATVEVGDRANIKCDFGSSVFAGSDSSVWTRGTSKIQVGERGIVRAGTFCEVTAYDQTIIFADDRVQITANGKVAVKVIGHKRIYSPVPPKCMVYKNERCKIVDLTE